MHGGRSSLALMLPYLLLGSFCAVWLVHIQAAGTVDTVDDFGWRGGLVVVLTQGTEMQKSICRYSICEILGK